MGMARGFSANGEFKKALTYAKKSLPLAPDTTNKKVVRKAKPESIYIYVPSLP